MPNDSAGSVTVMIRSLRGGDRNQVPALWDRYFERLTRLARPILKVGPTAAHGTEEDAASYAIDIFCNGIAEGKFPFVDSREVLWGTLAKITERRARQQLRRRYEVSLEALPAASSAEENGAVQLAIVEPTPEYKALVKVVLAELIEKLDNPLWRQAVLMLLEGYTVPEIAARLGRCRETVYLWFRAIREIWEEHLGGHSLLD